MSLRETAKTIAAALVENGQAHPNIDWAADILEPMLADLLNAERVACAKFVEHSSVFGDCEALGTMDPETGVRECGARYCYCEPRIEHGEMLAAKIRARSNQ